MDTREPVRQRICIFYSWRGRGLPRVPVGVFQEKEKGRQIVKLQVLGEVGGLWHQEGQAPEWEFGFS